MNACYECCDRHAASGRCGINFKRMLMAAPANTAYAELRDQAAPVCSLFNPSKAFKPAMWSQVYYRAAMLCW